MSQLVAATQAPQQALITNQTQAVTHADLRARHPEERAVDVSVLAERAGHAHCVQRADREQHRSRPRSPRPPAPVRVAGTYSVTVPTLAQAQQLLSKAFTGGGSDAPSAPAR